MIGGKFTPLTLLNADDTEVDTLVNSFNKALTESASEVLGKRRAVKSGDTRQQKRQESTEQLTRKLRRA